MSLRSWFKPEARARRTVDVGWVIDPAREATFIWDAPRKLGHAASSSAHAKSVANCPAVSDHEARLIEITCPIDIKLRFFRDAQGNPSMAAIDGEQSSIRPQQFSQMVMAVHPCGVAPPATSSHPGDDTASFYRGSAGLDDPDAGFLSPPAAASAWHDAGRRFPIHIWPRELVWAFEWHDVNTDLIIRRGDPWFYLSFRNRGSVGSRQDSGSRDDRAVADLYQRHARGQQLCEPHVFLFKTAAARRPEKLLVPKKFG